MLSNIFIFIEYKMLDQIFVQQINYNRLLITIFMTKLGVKDLIIITDLIYFLLL